MITCTRDVIKFERFVKIVVSAMADGSNGRLHRSMAGHDQDFGVGGGGLDLLEKVQAARVGQNDVQDRDGERTLRVADVPARLFCRARGGNFVPRFGQERVQDKANGVLIVNDEDAFRIHVGRHIKVQVPLSPCPGVRGGSRVFSATPGRGLR